MRSLIKQLCYLLRFLFHVERSLNKPLCGSFRFRVPVLQKDYTARQPSADSLGLPTTQRRLILIPTLLQMSLSNPSRGI